MNRREFIGALSAAAVAERLGIGRATAAPPGARAAAGEVPRRTLGRTGEAVSILGLGGAHIGRVKDAAESVRIVRAAIDAGLTFQDNSWDYNGGASELRMGEALQGGYRDRAFLMTKFDGRTRDSAARQIDESLRRLRTDHLDLMQLHEVIYPEDPDRAFADCA